MSHLTLDVTESQRQTLAALAAREGKTIGQYALERLLPTPPKEDTAEDTPADTAKDAATELKALLAERLAEAGRGELAQGSIREIAEAEIEAAHAG
jgi:hypothetical protein